MAESGDPTLKVRVEGDISQLEGKLKEAEKVVEKSGGNMGQAVDKNISKVADNLGKKIAKMIGAGFAIKALDDSLKIIAEGIRQGKGADDIALAIGDSVLEGLRRVPIAGPLGEILALAFDSAFGDALAKDEALKKVGEMQLKERMRQSSVEDLLIAAGGEAGIEAKYQRQLRLNREKEEQAGEAVPATERVFMQQDFDAAVTKALDEEIKSLKSKTIGPSFVGEDERRRMRNSIENRLRESFYQVGMGYSEDARKKLEEVRLAREAADARALADREEALSRLAQKQVAGDGGVPPSPGMVREPALPTESDVEEAVRDLGDEMEMQGTDTSIFETKLLTYAQDQLTELKDIARTLDRMSRQAVGLN